MAKIDIYNHNALDHPFILGGLIFCLIILSQNGMLTISTEKTTPKIIEVGSPGVECLAFTEKYQTEPIPFNLTYFNLNIVNYSVDSRCWEFNKDYILYKCELNSIESNYNSNEVICINSEGLTFVK